MFKKMFGFKDTPKGAVATEEADVVLTVKDIQDAIKGEVREALRELISHDLEITHMVPEYSHSGHMMYTHRTIKGELGEFLDKSTREALESHRNDLLQDSTFVDSVVEVLNRKQLKGRR